MPGMTDQLTVRDIRRRWKPTKERLATEDRNEPLRVRIHRCCSWLRHVEELRETDRGSDAVLIFQWSALESLFGQWDADRRRPRDERATLPEFLSLVFRLDRDGLIGLVLNDAQESAVSILTDVFLSQYFWDEPGVERARSSQRAGARAASWLETGQYRPLLDRVLERIELLHNQLVHGAASFDSKLNRQAVHQSIELMSLLMPAMLLVIIDHGSDADSAPLCYPPLQHSPVRFSPAQTDPTTP